MDPETQRMFTVALVGLLLFFPVFNQVAQTAVEALTDADHRAQMDDFFKDWDHVPDDRKLEYWDGRNIPEGHWDDMERDDDFSHGEPGTGPNGPGGEGENGEEEENETEDEARMEYREEVLWRFEGGNQWLEESEALQQRDYHWVNVSASYSMFTGYAEFDLESGGSVEWSLQVGTSDVPAVFDSDSDNESIPNLGTAPMTIDYVYDPSGTPSSFEVEIIGTYLVSTDP